MVAVETATCPTMLFKAEMWNLDTTFVRYRLLYATIEMTPIGIVGCGAASLLLLLLFSQEGIPPHDITIIDPSFDGGDLQRSWGPIRSNTRWQSLVDAIQSLNPSWKDTLLKYNPNETVPLSTLIRTLREAVNPYLQKCVLVYDTAVEANFTTDSWELVCKQKYRVNLLFVCTGSQPKSLSLPIPSIPLANALTSERLKHYVEPHNRVVVFGCQHSGTLVLKSLLELGCQQTTVIHRHSSNENPFLFARDGEYDGIKEEAAEIADKILRERPASIEFVQQHEFVKVAKALRTADWVVYSVGFTPRTDLRIQSNGIPVALGDYEPKTGRIPTATGYAWGFGIAFPNRAPDEKHYDVSIHSFAQHILNQKAELLEKYRSVISTKITNT